MQVNKLDWIVFNVALFCTMFAGVDIGLGISIGVSVILALYKSAFPKTSVLGRLPETTVFRYWSSVSRLLVGSCVEHSALRLTCKSRARAMHYRACSGWYISCNAAYHT